MSALPLHPTRPLTLAAGARLGPYQILSALGAGGMGEVYKARDTCLDRTAADVSPGAAFKAGIPKALFTARIHIGDEAADSAFRWDVAARGDRFLIDTAATASESVTLVLNWTASLKK